MSESADSIDADRKSPRWFGPGLAAIGIYSDLPIRDREPPLESKGKEYLAALRSSVDAHGRAVKRFVIVRPRVQYRRGRAHADSGDGSAQRRA